MRKVMLSALLAVLISGPANAADYKSGPYAGVTAGITTGYLTNNTGDLTTNGIPISGIVGYTLAQIADDCAASEASVSARLRDLRKPRFGGHTVERRRRTQSVWEYRLEVMV